MATEGLSPRVRGKLCVPGGRVPGRGSIPACAGEARRRSRRLRRSRVYPRVCGGSLRQRDDVVCLCGLSPRVRGKPCKAWRGWRRRRSIPACAGEALVRRVRPLGNKVYPRVCGGSIAEWRAAVAAEGLSPRVRGKPTHGADFTSLGRSIPACAGEARAHSPNAGRHRVYPRVCGGSVGNLISSANGGGLSPRVRGKPGKQLHRRGRHRSIPACAGEALTTCGISRLRWVYPRVCGGSAETGTTAGGARGLSPRVRGKQILPRRMRFKAGSIPACAGEAHWVACLRSLKQVYPRVCGGSAVQQVSKVAFQGLSPRVRGKHALVLTALVWPGSIPACAGEA